MKLTKVNSVITYENLYPISVKNVNNETTHSFEWMNKRLITLTYNQLNQQYRYTYNYKGLRTSVEKYVYFLLVSKKSYNYDIEGKLVLEKI